MDLYGKSVASKCTRQTYSPGFPKNPRKSPAEISHDTKTRKLRKFWILQDPPKRAMISYNPTVEQIADCLIQPAVLSRPSAVSATPNQLRPPEATFPLSLGEA
ncbi:hypothetical protein GCM10027082_19490 [Comamonas humi]